MYSEQVGTFTCRAENVAGSITSTSTVNIIPDTEWEEVVEFTSPRFTQRLMPIRVMDGEKVMFTCKVRKKKSKYICISENILLCVHNLI